MKQIEKRAIAHGLKDFKWIRPRSIVVEHWVRMKCQYGCPAYGKRGCCPPEVPPVEECRKFFQEYEKGLFFHFAKRLQNPKMRQTWSRGVNARMIELEREVFLSGFYKAFLFTQAPCRICKQCKSMKDECRQPYQARPTLEAFGVDVYVTARMMGYPIKVLKGYREEMNRFGLLLVE